MALVCVQCGKELIRKAQKKYCSQRCARDNFKEKYRQQNPRSGIPANTVGAIHELVAAIDLMRKGYSVFRAMSPAAPGDLVILNGKQTARLVEVTTGVRTSKGLLIFPPHKKHESTFDLIAVVERNGQITYLPEL